MSRVDASDILIRPAGFPDGVAAGFSTRRGGVSEAPFDSLNLGKSVGDDPKAVQENRRRAAHGLGFEPEALAIPGQVHGTDIKRVDAPGVYPGFDGLVTSTPGLLLAISAADCAAVLLADGEANVVGACHAGWRGCVAGVVEACLHEMKASGARAPRIRAWISPCISARKFEVGEEVSEQFDPAFVIRPPGAPRPFVDLPGAIRSRLLDRGLSPEHIASSGCCTASETDVFFSHRAENGKTGRMMGLIGLT